MTSGYHHGDLRNALLASGLELLEEGGLAAVTLRAVARRAGVSHAAPYHHFADKGAFVEALATAGFEALTTAMKAGIATASEDTLDQFRHTGLAYGEFAFGHPALFRLMNRSELRDGAPVATAAAGAYQVLEDAVRRCQDAGQMPPGDPTPFARTAWAAVHGVVILILDGMIDIAPGTSAQQLVDETTAVLGVGFMRRDGDPAC